MRAKSDRSNMAKCSQLLNKGDEQKDFIILSPILPYV